jgi:hypothetical protein
MSLVFPEDVGEVVIVNGKCYSKIVKTDLPVTNTADDVDEVFDTCDACFAYEQNHIYSNDTSTFIFPSNYGNALRLNGVGCVSYVGPTYEDATNDESDILCILDDIEDCTFEPPPALQRPSINGDPHLTFYGQASVDASFIVFQTVANASLFAPFNVDDNYSDKLMYFLVTRNTSDGTRLNLRYACDRFSYTEDAGGNVGWAVSTVSVGTELYEHVYSIKEDMSGAELSIDGREPVGTSGDEYDLGGVHIVITVRTVQESGCVDSVYSFLELSVVPRQGGVEGELTGLYDNTHMGGALWWIWKKLSQENSFPVNNLSRPGIDGIFEYTGKPRSDFESGTWQDQLEPVPQFIPGTQQEVSTKIIGDLFSSYRSIDSTIGNWTADWDPLAFIDPPCNIRYVHCTDSETYPDIIVNRYYGMSIKVDSECYYQDTSGLVADELTSPEPNITHTNLDDCDACYSSSSSSSSSGSESASSSSSSESFSSSSSSESASSSSSSESFSSSSSSESASSSSSSESLSSSSSSESASSSSSSESFSSSSSSESASSSSSSESLSNSSSSESLSSSSGTTPLYVDGKYYCFKWIFSSSPDCSGTPITGCGAYSATLGGFDGPPLVPEDFNCYDAGIGDYTKLISVNSGPYDSYGECFGVCAAPPLNSCNSCDPAIPDTLTITITGNTVGGCFGDDINGAHSVDWLSGCTWYNPTVANGCGIEVVWVGGNWAVRDGDGVISWTGPSTPCDPTGTYSADGGNDGSCVVS